MEILIKASQLILSLSILIVLHELGHFIPAKLFKTKVEKFYLFFDWKFSLFKFKRGETEYGIGWIPLGGYVKIAGMIDESMDTEQMKQAPQPWEFRSKPAWQRLIIMMGGVTVNFVLALIIYAGVLYANGQEFLPNSSVNYGITCDSLALEAGLRNGDKILKVDDNMVEEFSQIPLMVIMNEAKTITVERGGKVQTVELPAGIISKLIKSPKAFVTPRFPFVIKEFTDNSQGEKAGLMKKDVIVGVNGKELRYFDEIRAEVFASRNKEIEVQVSRNGNYETIRTTVPESGALGLYPYATSVYLTFETKTYTFAEAIPAGIDKGLTTFTDYLKQFKLIFNSEVKGYESVGGFITFGKVFAPTWDWNRFWNLTAFFSIALAIMNLLPIPALDGGHVMFLLYEVITRRKPNEKFLEYSQTVGMVLLLSLLVYANGNDIVKLFQ
jgi:regulator of sigma E protease